MFWGICFTSFPRSSYQMQLVPYCFCGEFTLQASRTKACNIFFGNLQYKLRELKLVRIFSGIYSTSFRKIKLVRIFVLGNLLYKLPEVIISDEACTVTFFSRKNPYKLPGAIVTTKACNLPPSPEAQHRHHSPASD